MKKYFRNFILIYAALVGVVFMFGMLDYETTSVLNLVSDRDNVTMIFIVPAILVLTFFSIRFLILGAGKPR